MIGAKDETDSSIAGHVPRCTLFLILTAPPRMCEDELAESGNRAACTTQERHRVKSWHATSSESLCLVKVEKVDEGKNRIPPWR